MTTSDRDDRAKPTPEAAEAAGPATPTEPAPTSFGLKPDAPAQPTPEAVAAAGPATPSAEPEAFDVGTVVGPLLITRLRDPKVLAGLGLLIAVLLLLRRRS